MNLNIQPVFFVSQSDFRKWLKKNHGKESELLVGFYKSGSGKPCMTWSESVDQAICFGWIDGFEKGMDGDRYATRFTRRRPKSNWTDANIERAQRMIEEGRMTDAGRATLPKGI